MDLFAHAAQQAAATAKEDWRTVKNFARDQWAQLTCDCGVKGPEICIPTDKIPQELWKEYVLEKSKWIESCPTCQPLPS